MDSQQRYVQFELFVSVVCTVPIDFVLRGNKCYYFFFIFDIDVYEAIYAIGMVSQMVTSVKLGK